MGTNIELKKVDAQGRVVLPFDWRDEELQGNQEVLIIREKGILKIIPKKSVDLTLFFDSLDLNIDLDSSAGNWNEMEREISRIKTRDEP
jgi:bifunctional DNA-binding transcriptional regulator/antitoxin component of YhaV-PrlF toxin-antitoxin module